MFALWGSAMALLILYEYWGIGMLIGRGMIATAAFVTAQIELNNSESGSWISQ